MQKKTVNQPTGDYHFAVNVKSFPYNLSCGTYKKEDSLLIFVIVNQG